MIEDKRLEQISDQIIRLANADFSTFGVLSEKGDELDSIVVGLNLLGEELESYTLQLKESEDTIRNTLVQLTEAQHLAHIGSWEWDAASDKISWSDELYRIYGLDPESCAPNFDNYFACIHPDDRERVNDVIQKGYQNKGPFGYSHRVLDGDGKERVLECRAEMYLNDDGSVKRMTGTAQDVTDLRKAEEKLMRLAAIVESSNDAIISKTTNGYITSWNKQAELLFGYTEKEILGQHISLLFPADRLSEEQLILERVNSGQSLNNFETERIRKNGSIVSVAATISPIKDPVGNIIGISNIIRDVTDKKLADEKLKAYTTALEQKNKETEQFAYIASHDLQEPLRTITNYIGLLDDDYRGKLDKSADKYLDFISGAARRMQTLITDLLEYTRIENDVTDVEIDCNTLLAEILRDMESVLTGSNATVQYEHLPVITGRYSWMRSLFQNLIGNAVKFRKPDVPPIVQISAADNGKNWLFEVKDNGIGIDKMYYGKIFMLFQRLHGRKEYQGTGIGLAQCKKIVDLRGGRIWVDSELGMGSSFYFILPKAFVL